MAGFRGLFILLLAAILGQASLAFTTTTTDRWYRTSTDSDPWYGATTDRGTTWDWRYQMSSSSSYGCGAKYRNSLSGYITSPNYPGDYFNNAHCEYIIDPGTSVYLQVVDKDLEGCCDHLVIYDQHGNNVTDNNYRYGSYFRVVFTSDGSAVRRGFKLYYGRDYRSFPTYSTTDSSYYRRSSNPYPWNDVSSTYPWYGATTDRGATPDWRYQTSSGYGTTWDWRYQMSSSSSYGCGATYRNSLSGYITSPNYPGDYFNNAHCEYIIEPGTSVYLQVVDKDLEGCCDHLVIYDQHGNNVTDNNYRYGSYFRVVFTSDGSVARRGFKLYYGRDYRSFPMYSTTDPWYWATTDRGWGSRWPYASTEGTSPDWRYQASSEYACGETSYSSSGAFQSPHYPNNYPNNLHCVYRIYTPYNIKLSIDYLQLEQKYDFLKIVYTDMYGRQRHMSFTGASLDTMVGSSFEITFTSDGSNTYQGFRLSWNIYDMSWVSTTNGYYQPSSIWWGWTSRAPSGNIMVTCDSRDFKVTVPREMIQQVFPGSSPYELTLDDPNCRGQIYYDVVMFRSSILGCGMTREETGYDIVYKNRIKTQVSGYYGATTTTRSIITRFNSKDISLECHLNRDVSIIGHFKPQHDHQLVARGSGNFSVQMDFYRDSSMNYRITSYPMYIGLNQDVYVDVGLESDDSDLKISLQNCVAKPSVDPYDYYNQYYLIRDGCPADRTVSFQYTSSLKHVHFRFRTFEFVRNSRDVYVFCYVRVCNNTDYDYRCRRDCNSMHRRVREASDDRTDHDLHIFQGPLAFREKRNADFQVAERTGGNDSSTTTAVPAIVMAIAAVAMVMAAAVMVIRGKRRNKSHTKGVDTEL
ncbi:deleted in malignant brain tumors 1 protein-like isoform X2 [Haliotis asinina]|uniref:deleted in malignant brain tumors 1 protein-like isoform X2 n=1 Tax=Haliotis asinina TaxID=109174 RepID=UPI0035319A7C